MINKEPVEHRLLRMRDVCRLTSLSKTMITNLCDEGKFPPRIQLGTRAIAWEYSAVQRWIEDKINYSKKYSFRCTEEELEAALAERDAKLAEEKNKSNEKE